MVMVVIRYEWSVELKQIYTHKMNDKENNTNIIMKG